MHLLTLTQPVDCGPNGIMPAGQLLLEDTNAAAILLQALPGSASMMPWLPPRSTALRVTINGRIGSPEELPHNILVIRPGAFGDLIQLTPALRALHRKHPDAYINVAVNPKFREVLLGLPYVHGLIPYPVPVERLAEFDLIIPLERALEHNPAAQDMTIVDAFALRLGVEVPAFDRKADLILTPEEKQWAKEKYPRDKRRRVVVQPTASDACRTYPMDKLKLVLRGLLEQGWEIMVVGEPKSVWIGPADGLYNLTADELSFRQSCAVAWTADAIFAPDSAFLHVAGALGKPAVGVFAAFHWNTRITNHPTVEAIQGVGKCSPCHHHRWGPWVWPKGQPCEKAGFCTVLAEIEPGRIVAKLNRLVPTA